MLFLFCDQLFYSILPVMNTGGLGFFSQPMHQQPDELTNIRFVPKRERFLSEAGMEHAIDQDGGGHHHHRGLNRMFWLMLRSRRLFEYAAACCPNTSDQL